MSVKKGDPEPQINGTCTRRQSRVGVMEDEMGVITFIGKDKDEIAHQGAHQCLHRSQTNCLKVTNLE